MSYTPYKHLFEIARGIANSMQQSPCQPSSRSFRWSKNSLPLVQPNH